MKVNHCFLYAMLVLFAASLAALVFLAVAEYAGLFDEMPQRGAGYREVPFPPKPEGVSTSE